MSIDKLMGIINNNISLVKENNTSQKLGEVGSAGNISNERGSLGDVVEISGRVNELEKSLSFLKSEIKNVPDIRSEKVDEAKARLNSGFYDNEEALEGMANSLMEASLAPLGT